MNTNNINKDLYKNLSAQEAHVQLRYLDGLTKNDTQFIAKHISQDNIKSLLLDTITFNDKGAFIVLSKALQNNNSIVDLSIRHTNITVSDSKYLSNILTDQAISPLKKLEFTDNNLGYKSTNTLLKKWSKKATGFFSKIFGRKSLQKAREEQKNAGTIAAIEKNNLTHLVLKDNKLDGHDMKKLSPVLARNHSIKHLDLSYNKLNLVGIKAVLGMLKAQGTINKLILREVVQCQKDDRKQALNYMYKTLKDDGQIDYLDVSQNHVRGMSPAFAKFLQYNKSVVTLVSDANRMTDEDVGRMCGALQHNKTLRHISLKGNPLGNKAIKYFIQLLGKCNNESLTTIEIDEPKDEEGKKLLNELNAKLNRNKLLLEKKMIEPLDKCMIKDLYKIVLEYL